MRKAIPRFRPTLAVALMFWCAGTGCLIVSYARGLTSDAAEAPQIEAQAMVAGSGATDAHACCKARHKALKQHDSAALRTNKSYSEHTQVILPASPAPSGAMSCCPLTSGSIVVASQSQTNDSNSTSGEKVSSDLLNVRVTNAPLAVPLRLPNRAQSYLLGCAFLI